VRSTLTVLHETWSRPGDRGEIDGDRRAPLSERLGLGPVPVPDGNPVAGRQEIVGHTRAHLPEPDEC